VTIHKRRNGKKTGVRRRLYVITDSCYWGRAEQTGARGRPNAELASTYVIRDNTPSENVAALYEAAITTC